MNSDTENEFIREFKRIQRGVQGFAEDMRAQGIHVGMGGHPTTGTR